MGGERRRPQPRCGGLTLQTFRLLPSARPSDYTSHLGGLNGSAKHYKIGLIRKLPGRASPMPTPNHARTSSQARHGLLRWAQLAQHEACRAVPGHARPVNKNIIKYFYYII
jgi:hypothetical protein